MLQLWRGSSKKYSSVRQDVTVSIDSPKVKDSNLLRPGWKATISLGAWVLASCLAANVAVLIWAYMRNGSIDIRNGVTTGMNFYKGDCDRVRLIMTLAHLAINILSTLILTAGTSCMQILGSPTREEVDVAHRKGRWFNIGLLSIRNLLGVTRIRLVLYCILGLTSIPLHFFYNGVVYSTLSVSDSLSIVTTDKFVTENAVNITRLDNIVAQRKSIYPDWDYGEFVGKNLWLNFDNTHLPAYPSNQQFQDAVNALKPVPGNTLTNLTWDKCIELFQKAPYQHQQNVALVTSVPNTQDDILDLSLTLTPGQVSWACSFSNSTFKSTNDLLGKCNEPANGTMPALQGLTTNYDEMWHVKYCLVKQDEGQCEITFYPLLMVIVIAMNVLKLVIILYTLFGMNFRPLVTAGDAVVSFMQYPDPATEGVGAHSTQSVVHSSRVEVFRKRLPKSWFGATLDEEHHYNDNDNDNNRKNTMSSFGSRRREKKKDRLVKEHEKLMHNSVWNLRPQRWWIAVSRIRWAVTIIPWSIFTGAIIYYIFDAGDDTDTQGTQKIDTHGQKSIDQQIGDLTPGFSSTGASNNSLISLVYYSNLPQVLVSMVWILLTACVTSMLIAFEMSNFAKKAKGMRVSPPQVGAQRCTYFLQIPYRYYIPMTITVIALHWLASESLFLERLAQYDINGQLVTAELLSTLGYSVRAIVVSAVLSGLMTLSPILLGLRKFPRGIPILGYNSLALSIACHPPPDEPPEPWARPLQYGLFQVPDEHGMTRPHVGFTSGPVTTLVEGMPYESTRCLSVVLSPDGHSEASCTLNKPVVEEELMTYESYRKS